MPRSLKRPLTAQTIQILPEKGIKTFTQGSQVTRLSGKQKSMLTLEKQPELARIKPKKIFYDKEKLYEETIHLKNDLNRLLKDNNLLRVKVTNLNRENEKYEKMVESFQKEKQHQIH